MNDLMTKGEFNFSSLDLDDPTITLDISLNNNLKNIILTVYKNDIAIGSATCDQSLNKTVEIDNGDEFKFVYKYNGGTSLIPKNLYLYLEHESNGKCVVDIKQNPVSIDKSIDKTITGIIKYPFAIDETTNQHIYSDVIGNIGTLKCYIQ
jgi:hypothetical protein